MSEKRNSRFSVTDYFQSNHLLEGAINISIERFPEGKLNQIEKASADYIDLVQQIIETDQSDEALS